MSGNGRALHFSIHMFVAHIMNKNLTYTATQIQISTKYECSCNIQNSIL